ncbi:MAG: ABC transporter ATP-binding protein [Clostridia bacterium]|nr:ABC transporter ATP-binding protein [Clostridia bacterium]
MAVLEIKDLNFSYGKRKILNGIDFAIKKGEIFCIFGPNGCGKTTMLDCVLGLQKAEKGEIFFEGKNITEMKIEEIARKVAYVPQKHQHTFGYTVLEMVLMGRTAHTSMFDSPKKEDIKIAEACLKNVGMYAFKDRIFNNLSGGEAQLVKLARALAQETNLIIFDEPTSHLDFRHELNVIKYMAKLIKEFDMSIIMATHFPNHAFYFENQGLNTKVAMMENGVFYAKGRAEEVLDEENMSRIFKIKTKVYKNVEADHFFNYMVPIDFSDGGQWHAS